MIYKNKENFESNVTGWVIFLILPTIDWTYEEKTTKTLGLNFRAKTEFPLLFVAGMELNLIANINSAFSLFGIELAMAIGKVRNKRY